LNITIKYIPKEHTVDVLIGSLKDKIQHEVFLWKPDYWRRYLGWQEKWKAKLWQQGSLPLIVTKMEVLLPLAIHNV